MKKNRKLEFFIFLALQLGGLNFISKANAQESKAIEIALMPQKGFSFSYFESAKGFAKSDLVYTRFMASKDFYWGLGLQARYHNDWTTTATISNSFMGGGYRTQKNGRSTLAEITNCFSLNFEKKLMETKSLSLLQKNIDVRLNLLWDAGVYWIPSSDRVVETKNGYVFGVYSEWKSTPVNNVTGNVNIGLTSQVSINKKPRLKVSALYTYGLSPSRIFEYKLTYPEPVNPEERFNVYTGKHRLALYAEIPIV